MSTEQGFFFSFLSLVKTIDINLNIINNTYAQLPKEIFAQLDLLFITI